MAKKEINTNGLQQLKLQLREKNPGRLYFFYGEETFLLHHYQEQLRKQLIDPLTESFNYQKLNAENFSLTAFSGCVESLPMMAEHTMVVVDEIDIFKLPEADRETLMEVFSDIPEYCTVLFTYVTTPWNPDKRLKKFFESITTYGLQVEFCKQDQRDLIPWIARHFAANGKRISPKLCSYLIELTGGTMTALLGEISKICAFSGAEEICQNDIDAVVEPVLEAAVAQMTELIADGSYGAALTKLCQLRKMQQEPLMILGFIGSHFRKLQTAKVMQSNKISSLELARLYGISDYAAQRTMRSANRFQSDFLEKAANLVLETDYQIKTSYDDPDRLMELLVLSLAQEARNG